MKTSLFSLLTVGLSLMTAPLATVRADDGTGQTNLAAAPSDGAGTNAQGEHGGRWREAFGQLGLTDAQKEQIKQIRANTSPGKERRQQIMGVLTDNQKAKLKQLIEQYRSAKQADGGTTAPNAN